MYVPSIFKSVQRLACYAGNNTITATDINYTELTATIGSTNASGFAAPFYAIDQNSPTNLNVHVLSPVIGVPGPAILQVVVKEYTPFFFRRPFYHNYGIIDTQQLVGYSNTGIAFGPKAYVVTRGWNYYFSRAGLDLEIGDAQIWSSLALPNPANGQVILTRKMKDFANNPDTPEYNRQGPLYHWYTIIDPW